MSGHNSPKTNALRSFAGEKKLEARGGIEPPMKVLQTFALPLGDRAPSTKSPFTGSRTAPTREEPSSLKQMIAKIITSTQLPVSMQISASLQKNNL
jgi:hypothetical protein